jgi:tetratricopeptide (TPR) repeat protein
VSVAEQSGDRLAAYIGYGIGARVESHLGHHENARRGMAQQQAIVEILGERRLIIDDWFAAIKAEIEFNAGRIEEALALAEAAVSYARSTDGIYAEGLAQRVWALALAALSPSRWDDAQIHLAASLQAFQAGETLPEVARTHRCWGLLCRDHQERIAARTHLEQAVATFETCGLDDECEQTRKLQDISQK